MVRAPSRMRSWARAERPSRVTAFFFAIGGDGAMFANHFGQHLGVGVGLFVGEVARDLPVPCGKHSSGTASESSDFEEHGRGKL
jgi:hypothetical protein